MSKSAAVFCSLALWLALAGCGYRTAGRAVRIPAEVHTIAIPTFVNQTQSYRVEQVLTAAVVREFLSRTRYRVVNHADTDADAVLRGTVISTQLAPVTYDSQTGRASSAIVTVHMQVTLEDRHGKVLFANPSYQFRQQYQISREITSFFEEESPAIDRLSREFARTLVSNILEGF